MAEERTGGGDAPFVVTLTEGPSLFREEYEGFRRSTACQLWEAAYGKTVTFEAYARMRTTVAVAVAAGPVPPLTAVADWCVDVLKGGAVKYPYPPVDVVMGACGGFENPVRDLFVAGDFAAHSGGMLPWKIDCDALSDASITAMAKEIASRIHFGIAQGIPEGGRRLASALRQYEYRNDPLILLVDDVLTTGGSMEETRAGLLAAGVPPDRVAGVVLFARRTPPPWVRAVFQLWGPA
jgi:hypothetical protein